MKPSDYVVQQNKHFKKAVNVISGMFKKDSFIKPDYEKLVRLKDSGDWVYRFKWNITKTFWKSVFIYGCKIIHSDIDTRQYVVDVYEDNTVDYIVDKEKSE